MSKERLEEFREFIDFMYESIDIEDHQRFIAISESMIKDGWFKWIYRFANEQAERVQELERINKQLKNNLSVYKGYYKNTLKINEDVIEENKKYRNLIKDMGREIEVLTDVMSNADNADELNEEVIILKGMRGYGNEVS